MATKSCLTKGVTVGLLVFSVWIQSLESAFTFCLYTDASRCVNKFIDLSPWRSPMRCATLEDTFNQFSPRFSTWPATGGWLKHMIFSYDLVV